LRIEGAAFGPRLDRAWSVAGYRLQDRVAADLHEERDPRDGRSRALSLSVDGLAAHRQANRLFERAYQRFIAHIANETAVKTALASVEDAAREARSDLSRQPPTTRVSRAKPSALPVQR
jgi:hypothetical protein